MTAYNLSKVEVDNLLSDANEYEITCISTNLVLSNSWKEIIKEFTFELPFSDLEDCSTTVDCRVLPDTERIIHIELQHLAQPNLYNCYVILAQKYEFTIHCLSGDQIFTKDLIFPVLCTLSIPHQGPFDINADINPSYCSCLLTKGETYLSRYTGEQPGEQFAFAVTFNNNPPSICVGSPSATFGTDQDVGKITVLSYPWGEELFQVFGSAKDDEFGFALDASSYDLNGDGWNDILVGAPSANVGSALRAGYIRVLSGLDGSILREIKNTEAEAQFGWSVSWAGDLDGDGVPDILVGAPQASPGAKINAGSVFVFSGATGSLLYRLDGQNADDAFGYAVRAIGDVDGDGIPDFAVGAPFASPPSLAQAGIVFIYSGAGGSLLYTIEGMEINAGLGFSLGAIADLNGDGVPDILVGTPDSSPNGRTEAGSSYIFSGLDGSQLLYFPGQVSGEEAGIAISSTGNFDIAGFPDFLLGAPSASPDNIRFAGKVYLLSSDTGDILRVFQGNKAWAQFGWSVSSTGEENSRSIFIGSPGIDTLEVYQLDASKLSCVITAAVVITVTKKADIFIPAFSHDQFVCR